MERTISDYLMAPWTIGVVFAAIRLKLFTILSDGEMPAEEISGQCRANPRFLRPLLDACVALGLMNSQGNNYTNSDFSRIYFVEGRESYVGDFLDLLNDESARWYDMPEIIRGTHEAGLVKAYLQTDYGTFIRAMDNIGRLGEAAALRDAVDLSGRREMVDAGGGSGLYSITLCRKYPDLHSTILDRGEVLAVTREMIADCAVKDRITLRETDLVEDSYGEGIGVVLLSDVIYEETSALRVLENAWNCLRPEGLLLIRGYYADPEGTRPLFGALFAVKELVDDAQRTIMTVSALEKNVRNVGFAISRMSPLTEYSFLLVGRK
ncbi:MAG: hypothetical protein JSV33_05675 [bacterium]|nr:MAG: hypothetical protein JSV33_05675 [bacterium]